MTTDDAALTTARSCQVETFFQHARGDAQLWVLPACNPMGALEFTGGVTLDWPQGDANDSRDYVLQLKWLAPNPAWLPDTKARYGLVAGATYLDEAHRGTHGWQQRYLYVPLTANLDGHTQLHVNLGYAGDRLAHTDDLSYAAALSRDLNRRFSLFAEVFGTDRAAPVVQTGAALTLGSFQLDASFGRPANGEWRDAVFSIGLEWYPNALW